MTYEQFEEALVLTDIDADCGFVSCEWITGGMQGGDCWGSDNYPVSAQKEPAFDELDKLLLAVAPQLTMLQYKAIERELIHRTFKTRDDYYGNYDDVAYKKVSLHELHAWLSDKGLLKTA